MAEGIRPVARRFGFVMSARLGRGVLIVGLACAAGCEKMPWSSGEKPAQPAAASATTTAVATQATMPDHPAIAAADVLATINGVAVSKADIQLRLKELKLLVTSTGQQWKPLTSQQLDGLMKELVNTELMSQDAEARGLGRSAEAQQRWAILRRNFFAQEWLNWSKEKLDVSSAEIEQYYEKNKLGFREPERRKLRQLTVASEDQAKQALARLLGESMDFAALVQQISISSNAPTGGVIPDWVMRANEKLYMYPGEAEAKAAGVTSLDPALEAAAFAIDHVSGFSNYVKGPDNRYHIFQLTELKEARQRPSSELWDGIKNFLLAQKLQDAIGELRTKAKLEEFPERLQGIEQ